MSSNLFSPGKAGWMLIPFALAVLLLTGIHSCTDESGKTETKEQQLTGSEDTCRAILTKSKISAAWPTSAQLKSIDYLKLYPGYNHVSKAFSVAVRAYDASNKEIGSLVTLDQGSASCPLFLENAAIGQNIVSMKQLNILEADGSLKNFDHIRFTPVAFKKESITFLNLSVEVFTGGESLMVLQGSFPCPPCYYCRPIPPDCVYDTTISQDTMESLQSLDATKGQ